MTARLQYPFAVLAAFLLTLSVGISGSAQNLDAIAGHLGIEKLTGIEVAVSRTYAADIDMFVDAVAYTTPTYVSPPGPILMLATVMQFDTTDHAASAASTVHDRLVKQLSADPKGIEVESKPRDDIGDRGWSISGTPISGIEQVRIDGLLVQKSGWLYLALTISDNDTGSDATIALITFALTNRPEPVDVIYDHTGLSRGGIWNKLPTAGNTISIGQTRKVDAISGTQPIFDNQLLPPPEE